MLADDAAFRLTARQRDSLHRLVRLTREARLLRRAQALRWRAESDRTTAIAAKLGVSRQTVHHWVIRFATRAGTVAERLAEGERSGRPATAQGRIDPRIAGRIDSDPREGGYAVTAGTAPLRPKHWAD
jgi:DNA-binding CsgD family transcriptional regulator